MSELIFLWLIIKFLKSTNLEIFVTRDIKSSQHFEKWNLTICRRWIIFFAHHNLKILSISILCRTLKAFTLHFRCRLRKWMSFAWYHRSIKTLLTFAIYSQWIYWEYQLKWNIKMKMAIRGIRVEYLIFNIPRVKLKVLYYSGIKQRRIFKSNKNELIQFSFNNLKLLGSCFEFCIFSNPNNFDNNKIRNLMLVATLREWSDCTRNICIDDISISIVMMTTLAFLLIIQWKICNWKSCQFFSWWKINEKLIGKTFFHFTRLFALQRKLTFQFSIFHI